MGASGRKRVTKMIGATAEGLPDTPRKMGNVRLSRIVHGQERGCSYCFPHGIETNNGTARKNRRSWKNHRKTKYRLKK
ncbi:MAG TPA: hypothetical protein VHD56_09885 [Tepidisphaeraceae bacterium]|nr:hypothetical protein [Tepidisphaeraceae bacterium]